MSVAATAYSFWTRKLSVPPERGAGTYSDGKLYTRATKREDVDQVLKTLVAHGADRDILIDAHPHIGSDRLPGIVRRIREAILACGAC